MSNLHSAHLQVECLNQQDSHPVRNILNPGSAYLESDVDEQLSIFLNVCVLFGIALNTSSYNIAKFSLYQLVVHQKVIDQNPSVYSLIVKTQLVSTKLKALNQHKIST